MTYDVVGVRHRMTNDVVRHIGIQVTVVYDIVGQTYYIVGWQESRCVEPLAPTLRNAQHNKTHSPYPYSQYGTRTTQGTHRTDKFLKPKAAFKAHKKIHRCSPTLYYNSCSSSQYETNKIHVSYYSVSLYFFQSTSFRRWVRVFGSRLFHQQIQLHYTLLNYFEYIMYIILLLCAIIFLLFQLSH
jgi:hypothetical protein